MLAACTHCALVAVAGGRKGFKVRKETLIMACLSPCRLQSSQAATHLCTKIVFMPRAVAMAQAC